MPRANLQVNPRDSDSAPVFQLETAMGSAIECFHSAGAIVVPRTRFAPVKTCNDLFVLRSDAYKVCKNNKNMQSSFCPRVAGPHVHAVSVLHLSGCVAHCVCTALQCNALRAANRCCLERAVAPAVWLCCPRHCT